MSNRFLPCWSLMRMIGSPSGLVLKTIKAGLFGGAIRYADLTWANYSPTVVPSWRRYSAQRPTISSLTPASTQSALVTDPESFLERVL
jgi:hypothetical protein